METNFPSLTLFVGPMPGIDTALLPQKLSEIQEILFYELGLITPLIPMEFDPKLPEQNFYLKIDDRYQPQVVGLSPGEFWVGLSREEYKVSLADLSNDQTRELLYEIIQRDSANPNSGEPAIILRLSPVLEDRFREANFNMIENFRKEGFPVREQMGYIIFNVAADLRKNAAELLSPALVSYYLKKIGTDFPDLVAAADQELGLEPIRQALQARLKNGQSIFNFPTVLDQLLASG